MLGEGRVERVLESDLLNDEQAALERLAAILKEAITQIAQT
jgi:malate/lactate dehydrogenase